MGGFLGTCLRFSAVHYILYDPAVHNPDDSSGPDGDLVVMGDQDYRPALPVKLL